MAEISAGLLMYRSKEDLFGKKLEFFLVHPGGPFYKKKDEGAWSIPKGLVEEGEDLLKTAIREFEEETGIEAEGDFIDLGFVKLKSGKIVHAFAFQGDLPKNFELKSNTFSLEWPPKSGRLVEFPEVDKGEFFALDIAKKKINEAQVPFIERLENHF